MWPLSLFTTRIATVSASSDEDGSPSDEDAAAAYVRELQRDGRLLLRYVARQIDRPLELQPSTVSTGIAGRHVLMADPRGVANDHTLLASLATCVDYFSRRAAPASASTIRLTGAYLRVAVENGEPPPLVVIRAKKLKD